MITLNNDISFYKYTKFMKGLCEVASSEYPEILSVWNSTCHVVITITYCTQANAVLCWCILITRFP